MTLLQITAIEIQRRGPKCCRGLINHAAIGRTRGPITAREIATDVRHKREQYFAMINGSYLTITVGHCATCNEPFLLADGDTYLTNRLLRLPDIDEAVQAPATASR